MKGYRLSQPSRTKNKLGFAFAVMPHEVIDSQAYADLNGEAVRLLTIAARQWNKNNNGHIQLVFSYCSKRGIGSEHTLKSSIDSLISHGFIYRTRCHGTSNGRNICARYALTWLPMSKDTNGLFLDGYVFDAWREWKQIEKIPRGKKCRPTPAISAVLPPPVPAQSAAPPAAQSAGYEYLAIYGACDSMVYRRIENSQRFNYRPIKRNGAWHVR